MDYHFIKFYLFYHKSWVRVFRILAPSILALAIIFKFFSHSSPVILLGIFNIFVMAELFYRYKINLIKPKKTVWEVDVQDILQAMTLPALSATVASSSSYAVVKKLLSYPQVIFFLERAVIYPQDLIDADLGNASLSEEAYRLAKLRNGLFITAPDLLASYLLLSEEKTNLLFNKKLKEKDVLAILSWTRLVFSQEEEQKNLHVDGNGGGIGQFLVMGWTPETKNYTRNFTNSLREEDVSIVGREKEYELMIEILLKQENNNLVLVGEAGVGKEQLVKKLALDSYSGRINNRLAYKTVLELLVGPLISGVTSQGDLESRIEAIIAEVSHAQNIILYVPNLENIVGGGSFSLDLSGALSPYIKNGTLPIIASMTNSAYKTYFEKSSLNQSFSTINVPEIGEDIAQLMVMEKTPELENQSEIIITYSALVESVKYADRYTKSMVLPGSSLTLLSDAISGVLLGETLIYPKTKKKLLDGDTVVRLVEQKIKIVLSEPTQKEKDLLLNLEVVLHRRVIGQDTAIRVVSEAMRRLRAGIEDRKRPISFLFLGPTGVGKTETAKALADTYFGGEKSLVRFDMSEYASEEDQVRLLGSLPGRGEDRGELTEEIRDHPYSLVLLDEFEKAHRSIRDLFLQIFEDGRLTDNKGRTVSFINTIIIATSNAGSDFIHKAIGSSKLLDKQFDAGLLEYLQVQHIFRPELLNRFDAIVTFRPLTEEEVKSITSLLMGELKKKLMEKDIILEIDDPVIEKVSQEAYSKEMGARPIRRYIQDNIESLISQEILSGSTARGTSMRVTVGDSEFVLLT